MAYFNVKAILRTDKQRKDTTCPVYILVSIKGKSIKLPSGIYGFSQEWEPKLGVFIESASGIRNSVLRKKIAAIEEFLWQQVAANNELSVGLVRFHFGKSGSSDFHALLDECYKVQFRLLAPSTKKHYLLVRRRLLEFQEKIGLNTINHDFLMRFETFLRDKGIGDGGVGTHHKVLRVVLNYGIRKKVIAENPYFYFKVKRAQSRYANLSEEQVRAIQSLHMGAGQNKFQKGLGLTRDLFLFSCYTALRFGDVQSLTRHDIVNASYLMIRQRKTGVAVQVPLLERSIEIIERYASPDRELLFPFISNQAANRHLKQIAKMCGIDTNLHFHLSRHSFGSIMANSGVNAFSLSKLMGHSSIKTTMLYVNSNLEKVREQMSKASIFDKPTSISEAP